MIGPRVHMGPIKITSRSPQKKNLTFFIVSLLGLTQRIASAIFLVKDMAEAYINVSLMPGNAIRSIKQMSQKHVIYDIFKFDVYLFLGTQTSDCAAMKKCKGRECRCEQDACEYKKIHYPPPPSSWTSIFNMYRVRSLCKPVC